jgi:hypothetical protein
MTKREENKLDKEIEKIYNRVGAGVQIDMFDISKIFKAGKDAHIAGQSVEEAVKAAIAQYRKNC